ncbi:MAG: helix-turn-helix domain-containing protein, partial [Eggerthella lenta]
FPRVVRVQCRPPRFVSVRYYLSGSCVESVTNRTVEAPYLEGHVLDTPHWDCLCRAGTPIRNVEIMLAPPFYEQYLREVYRDEAFSAEEAFASIDGLSDFPEMVVLLKQVEAYRGRGASARLFYRSKVEEAVALVVDKSRAMAGERASELASEDMHAIERVRRRLEQQLAAPVDADELARIACMGRPAAAHLQAGVRLHHRGVPPALRCAKAAELLAAGDAPVAQVAAAVGYRPERLAELFARTHHTTPSAYRAAMR